MADEAVVVPDPTQIDVKLFNRWSFDDIEVPISMFLGFSCLLNYILKICDVYFVLMFFSMCSYVKCVIIVDFSVFV